MAAQITISVGITGTLVNNSVESFQLSKRFTKHMVKCSIFNILANRITVNEADLKVKYLETVPFFILKRRSKNIKDPHFQRFLKWVDGIDDSIDKSFLKEIFLFMKNVQTNDIVESYKFKLKYNLDNQHTNKPSLSNENVKHDVLTFLKLLKQLGDKKKLDESTVVEIEFKYNDNTPFEYEPPGFKFANQPYCTLIKNPCDTYLCSINTGYHQLSCMGQNRMITDGHAIGEEENVSNKIQVPKGTKLERSEKPEKRKINISNITVSIDESLKTLNSDDTVEDIANDINCICEIPLPYVEQLCCFSCKSMFHFICCGFLEVPTYCDKCYCPMCDPNNLKTFSDNKKGARLRLLLYYLSKDNLDSILPLIPNDGTDGYAILKEFDIISEDKTVNQDLLQHLISILFKGPDSQFFDV